MNPVLIKNFKADNEITPNTIVKLTTTGVANATKATDALLGITYPDISVPAGDQTDVVMSGVTEVKTGGAIAIGEWVTSDNSGRAIKTTTAGNIVIGQALESANGADEIIKINMTTFVL